MVHNDLFYGFHESIFIYSVVQEFIFFLLLKQMPVPGKPVGRHLYFYPSFTDTLQCCKNDPCSILLFFVINKTIVESFTVFAVKLQSTRNFYVRKYTPSSRPLCSKPNRLFARWWRTHRNLQLLLCKGHGRHILPAYRRYRP